MVDSSHEALLSDEEAQEVVRLLSPEKDKDEPEWLQDVLSASLDNRSVITELSSHQCSAHQASSFFLQTHIAIRCMRIMYCNLFKDLEILIVCGQYILDSILL